MSNQMPFYLWKRIDGEREHDRFGDKIVCGDINGDGYDEWIISASTAAFVEDEGGVNPIPYYYVGRIYVFSNDWQLLFTINGENAGDRFGSSLVLGDINGDGIKEIIVSSPGASNDQWIQCGMISVFSGKTGKLLKKWNGKDDYERLGSAMTVLDWNGDGIPDLAASSNLSNPNGENLNGRVTIFSGTDAHIIDQFTGIDHEGLGLSLTAGDVNGDGKEEIIIGAPLSSNSGLSKNGRVLVYSKENGLIFQAAGKRSFDNYGTTIATGDLDGDGVKELIIGTPNASFDLKGDGTQQLQYGPLKTDFKNSGMVSVISVVKDQILLEKGGWYQYQGLGVSIQPFADQAEGSKKILIGSNAGVTYLIDMKGKIVHEFSGFGPEAFSHSLVVEHREKEHFIAIGAVSGLNKKKFMSGSVYIISTTIPPIENKENDPMPNVRESSLPLSEESHLTQYKIETEDNSKMKILFATYWYLPHVGGVDVYIRTLKEELENRGYHVDVMAHHPDMAHYYLVGGDKKVAKWPIKQVIYDKVFQFYQRYLPHIDPWVRWRDIERYCFEAAASLFNLEQYDIIHTQDIVSTRALSRVKPASTPLVATIHGLLAKEHLISGEIKTKDSLAWKYVSDEELYGNISAEATIVPTNWLRQEMTQFKVPSEKLTVIPYGIDIDAFENKTNQPLSKSAEKKGTFTISCPARLVPVKGHRILIKALNRLKSIDSSWHCWLIGDGELRKDLEVQVNKFGLNEQVTFLGDRDDVPSLLKQSDLMVLPSLQDNLPFSIMEAQLAGVPIIASNTGGIPEMIDNEQTGLLFDVGNDEHLSQQIQRMIIDKELRENTAKAARNWAEREWSINTIIDRTIKVYEIASGKAGI